MRRTTRLVTVLVTAAAVLLPGTVAQATPAVTRHTPAVQWAPCEQVATAECGTLRVPVDWSRPWGPTLDLALARRPATDPDARIGSLVVNPGGPGGSGVDFVLQAAEYFSADLRARFDLVGLDPRGVARSNPVLCSLDLINQAPSPLVESQREFEALVDYNRRLGRDCRARTGPVFDHVDTLSVVHDLDAVRAALGDRKLSYYGISYGTLIGQQYAEEYPYRVRALVLDSNMDHSLGTRGFVDTQARAAQSSFDEFVAWCDRTPECALHGEDVRAVWDDLLERADDGELRDPFAPEAVLTSYGLIGYAFSAFYGPDWMFLADLMVTLDTGDQASGLTRQQSLAGPVRAWQEPEEPEEVAEFAFPAVFCQDWHLPVRDYREFARHQRRMARMAPDMRYSPLAVSATAACLGWPSKVKNPQHRLRVPPGPELLLTNALFDPATGYEWATNAARQLRRNAVLLTYEGWGHGVYRRSDCTTVPFDDYLISLKRPDRGARCPAVEPEFFGVQRQPALPPLPGPRPDLPGWSSIGS